MLLKKILIIALSLLIAAILCCGAFANDETKTDKVKQIREPLPYRIVSFHRGRADKILIRRAAELGFNGVQFRLEGGNVSALKGFAERNQKEGYIDLCHSLGMKVTLWVHELSEIPKEGKPGYLGPIELGNDKLWSYLDQRYEWMLGELLPDIDGIVLTVVETQIRLTDTKMMLKLVDILRNKCHKYNKELIVRTFVWHPDELEGVMGCIKQIPDDVIIMTKCVPQDWQMRGIDDTTIGDVGNHKQIEEWDIEGEYFLKDKVANCMPDILKRQFDYGVQHGIDGICLRVDRDDAEILHEPAEVNLWTMGMLSTGKTDSVEDVWNAWATARYGAKAAPGVIKALKPTAQVITECLNIGHFTFGDTRGFPKNGDDDIFSRNWQNWRWDSSYVPLYKLGLAGDKLYTRKVIRQKNEAYKLAQQSLDELEKVKSDLDPIEYNILKTRLTSNKVNLEFRAPMMIAYLYYRRILNTQDATEKQSLAEKIREDLKIIRAVGNKQFPPNRKIEHMGRNWIVDSPDGIDQKQIIEWVNKMESLLTAQGLAVK